MPNLLESALRRVIESGVDKVAAFNRRRLASAGSPFLVGIHAPMRAELTLENLAVTGTIPAGLCGRYLRMGANPAAPDPAGHHWFLGDGMVHGFAIGGGRVHWYRNRWIGSRLAAAALGRAPAPGPRRGRNDTVNTNIVDIGGRAFAVVEAGSFPVELSATLDEQRYSSFDDTLVGSFSGHPHRDPLTGEHHAIAYDGNVWDAVRHVVVSDAGLVVRDVSVPVAHGPCIHDCGFTARFVIVLDLPVTFSMRAVLGGHVFPYRWNPGHRARVGLLPRAGAGDGVIWCELEACFAFHVSNAYDRADGAVVLDVIGYDTMFASGAGGLDALGRFERWTVDPVARSVSRAVIAGATQIYKHDLQTGGRQVHDFGAGYVPGEFVFVPASNEAMEDEGWLIGLVIDTAADATDLVILDAQAFTGSPAATVRVPHRIPPGFHGNWFPEKSLSPMLG